MAHTCGAILVTCMDFRFQKYLEDWARENLGERNYDRVSWVGGVFDLEGISKQIAISKRLHDIKKIVLVNHEDCGAYGEAGTHEKHALDLKNAKEVLEHAHGVEVETYFLHLDGAFEKV